MVGALGVLYSTLFKLDVREYLPFLALSQVLWGFLAALVSEACTVFTDAEGVIRGANPRAAELFGYAQAELYGQPIENLVPARFRARHPSHRENYNAHPRARQMGRRRSIRPPAAAQAPPGARRNLA